MRKSPVLAQSASRHRKGRTQWSESLKYLLHSSKIDLVITLDLLLHTEFSASLARPELFHTKWTFSIAGLRAVDRGVGILVDLHRPAPHIKADCAARGAITCEVKGTTLQSPPVLI